MRRNTIQKDLVLNAVHTLRSHVTADEVYNFIIKEHPSVGKGTVYRNLSILADEGLIRKIEIPNASDRYDFTLKEHYHVRCVRCGCIEDVELKYSSDIMNSVDVNHGFDLLGFDLLFRGVCGKCKEIEEEGDC